MPHHYNPAKKTKLFSLLTFSIAKKRLRQWDEGCDPYPSDNSVMTWLVPVYVHLLFLLVKIYTPWKLTCPPKKGPFCSRTWNIFEPSIFRGYSLVFTGTCPVSLVFVPYRWLMVDGSSGSFLGGLPTLLLSRREGSLLDSYQNLSSEGTHFFWVAALFTRNLHLLNHQPEFLILFWRDIYDSDGRTEINFRKGVGSVFHVGIQAEK